MKDLRIADRPIGRGRPPYVIAEIGINHNGDPETAHRMIDAAADAGADAVKLQTFRTESFLSRASAYFDVLRAAELPREALASLVRHAGERGTILFSAVFDEESADVWEQLNAPAYKIASGDVTHRPLIGHVAKFGKPMIISTGGATMPEIGRALESVAISNPQTSCALLHCVSNYPTRPADANLACMSTMRDEFGVPVGFSDHTVGVSVPIAAAALGAELIEKHFTLDRQQPGPDHKLSADPEQLKAMISDVRDAWAAIGRPEKTPVEAPEFIPQIRRSVTAAVDIPAGTLLDRKMLAVKRPGTGLSPDTLESLVGRRTLRAIAADRQLRRDDVEGEKT
jgi:N,N'-diacetyllegionaminate synthase